MPDNTAALTQKPEWHALIRHKEKLAETPMRDPFRDDPTRATRYLIEAAGLTLDFSRNRLTDDTLSALADLARACGLEQRTEALFTGGIVNITENRPALHTALRQPRSEEHTSELQSRPHLV